MNAYIYFFGSLLTYSIMMIVLTYSFIRYLNARRFNKTIYEKRKKELKELEHLHQKSQGIIEKAQEKASEIIEETSAVSKEMKKQLEQDLLKAEQNEEKELSLSREELEKARKDMMKRMQAKFSERLEAELSEVLNISSQELEDFRRILKQETLDAQSYISSRITQEFDKARAQIEDYKREKLDEIDKKSKELLVKVLEDAIGEAIGEKQQADLVTKSLEKAKKEGVLGG